MLGSPEELLRVMLQTMSDRVAGREYRHMDPSFYGVPDTDTFDEPDEAGEEADPTAVDGADPPSAVRNTSGSLAWGQHANGRIPKDQLVEVAKGHRLEASAAQQWKAMVADAKADGINLSLTDSYRSYAQQVSVRRRKGHVVATATPGTSNHGWGRAVDVNVNDPKVLRWLRANGEKYGWVNPAWAQRGGKSFEPWHWEFRAGGGAAPPPAHAHAHGRQPMKPVALDFSLPNNSAPNVKTRVDRADFR